MAKTKYMMHDCAYCHKQTKMELVGGMDVEGQDAAQAKLWYRCTRCKHSALVLASSTVKDKKGMAAKIERSDCVNYSKEKEFPIGQAIYHSDLEDMGRVIRKDKTSNGTHSITVSFEKVGEKKLLEHVTKELSEESFQHA
jgi:DNA-directed RNA polymerase subunit RPC12/RpoP